MYTWEINNIMNQYRYRIPANIYFKICETSPQITKIKREYDNKYYIQVCDNGIYREWRFDVYLSYPETFL